MSTTATSKDQITKEWLLQVLQAGGYHNTRYGQRDPEAVLGEHAQPTRPNVELKVRRDLNIITVVHTWAMKKPGWTGDGKLLAAINKANCVSWLDIFSQAPDGSLQVSSYVTLSDGLSAADVLFHLEKEGYLFIEVLNASGLRDWVK